MPEMPRLLTRAVALAAGFLSIAVLGGAVIAESRQTPAAATGSSSARAGSTDEPWPRTVTSADTTLTIYQPQIDAYDGFTTEATAAVSVARTGRDAQVFGVVSVTAKTMVDKVARLVTFDNMQVTSVSFPSAPPEAAAYEALVRKTIGARTRVFSLDRLEASLAIEAAREGSASLPLNDQPPAIVFARVPTILVYVDGAPVYRAVAGTRLERVLNTRPLVLKDAAGTHYVRVFDGWLQGPSLAGAWAIVASPSSELAAALTDATRSGVVDLLTGKSGEDDPANPPPSLKNGQAPAIHVATEPTELIVTDGAPNYAPLGSTRLLYVTNTTGNVFRFLGDQQIYVLTAGRWFRGPGEQGPWAFVANDALPADFASIPDDSPKENAKASVAGTPQAQEALIANSIPQTAEVAIASAKLTPPKFDGEPALAPVESTSLKYVVNSSTPIIMVDASHYYAVENGTWFVARAVTGPWAVATSVPAAIYAIPPSSPVHYVTYVRVYRATPTTVYVGYTPGYHGTCVSHGVVVYGTGYRYTPWVHTVWYGPPVTYGFGVSIVYNPWTGWSYGFGFGWSWGRVTAVTGWGWGPYPWWGPVGWGYYYPYPYYRPPYYRPYYGGAAVGPNGAVAWGPGGWAGTTGNVYHRWGSTTAVTRTSGGYNAWTGNRWATQVGTAYNSRTGVAAAGQRGGVHNVYTGDYAYGSRGVVQGPGGGTMSGGRVTAGNTRTGNEVSAGRVTVTDPNSGRSGSVSGISSDRGSVVRVGDEVYAGKDGNVYKKSSGGWEQVPPAGGRPVPLSDPARISTLERSATARTAGAARQRNVDGARASVPRSSGGRGGSAPRQR